jgi:CheY-like chemotaxis protein
MTEEYSEQNSTHLARLHALTRLASSPVQSIRAIRVVNEAVAALDVQACIFHHLERGTVPETIAVSSRPGLDPDALSALALSLLAEVEDARGVVLDDDLAQRFPEDPLVSAGTIGSYLGVPLFDSKGAVTGVASLLAPTGRILDGRDQWWIETAAHLVSAASACESIDEKLRELQPETNHEPRQDNFLDISSVGGLSVLVVDDDRSVNTLIRRYLTRKGYRVDSASHGLEAMRIFSPSKHDLVITDVVMPGMNGWELAATLRKAAPKLPVIIVTGYSSNNKGVWNKSFLQSQGIVAVLTKPLDFDHLATILEGLASTKAKANKFLL